MANKRRVNWISQQRVDLPDLRSIESAASADFDDLFKALVTGTAQGYVIRGFEIAMANAIGGAATSLQLIVDPGALLHINASQAGTTLLVATGTANESLNAATNTKVTGSFAPNATNYIGIDYTRTIDSSTNAQIYLWDPTSQSETTKIVPRAQILNYKIVITSSPWASNVLPICSVVTDAGNNVVSVEDNRSMIFRLGTGGLNPDPQYSYPWSAQSEGRTESPVISSSDSVNPFHGGDKMIDSQKSWNDAVMSVIKEIKGSAYWYQQGSAVGAVNLSDLFFDADSSVITMRGKFSHSGVTPGLLSWTGDLHLRSIIGNLTYVVPSASVQLNDGQVAYISLVRNQNFQPANTFTFVNGSNTVSAVETIAGISAGDWILYFSDNQSQWAQVQSVTNGVGTFFITLTSAYLGSSASGTALRSQGSYTMRVASPTAVPVSSDTYWIAKRDDNGQITASFTAAPTGAVRASDIATFQTTAPHNINPGQIVIVAGVTDTTFNGEFEVLTIPDSTHFTVENTGPDATSGSGTVNSVATIYLRGIGAVSQSEDIGVPGSTIEAILQYIGSEGPTDNQPQYSSTHYVTQGKDLTGAVGQLDAALYADYQALLAAIAALGGQSNADRNLKLIQGGTWSFVAPGPGATLTLSSNAYIQIPGLADSVNTILPQTITFTAPDEVAYVEVNRTGPGGNLTVTVAPIASITIDQNTTIIARYCNDASCIVGTHSFRLIDGESKSVDAGLSNQTLQLIGGTTNPVTEATSLAHFSTRGSPQRTIDDTQSILDAQASMDAEIDKFFGQLRVIPHESSVSKVRVTGANRTMKDGSTLSQSANSKFIDFDGAVIDLVTGNIYHSDGVTALGANFTPVVIPSGNYLWYGISIAVDTTDSLNGTTVKINVTASTSSSPVSTTAPYPSLSSSNINSGAVLVQNIGGTPTLSTIKSLGVGSGGGGGGGTALIQPKATAIAYTNGATQEFNCDPPTVFAGKMRLLLHFNMDAGDFVEVYLNQKKVPLFINLATTPGPYYKVIANNLLEFDQDYTSSSPAQLIEIETFAPAPQVSVPSMLAGLQLKGRSYSTTDNAVLYDTTSNVPVAGQTVVTTTFDILTTDVIFVEVGGVYYPQFLDSAVTTGNWWKLIGQNTIQFNSDLSGTTVPVDIRVFQGQSFIDELGNVSIVLKAAMDNIILQSPDTTKWMVEVTNLGELDPTVVTIGSPDPIRLRRDGDNVICAFVIDNAGELGVDDAPSAGIVVDTLHLQAPNGMVWRVGINEDSSIYLQDGFGNTFTLKDDEGNVLWQINEVVGGAIEQQEFFPDSTMLPTPPPLVSGAVPQCMAYNVAENRIYPYVYTNGNWLQVPLLEPGLTDTLGVPVGSPFESMLTQAQMDALYGTNKCVIADGRNVAGSRYATITGQPAIPDLRGMYLRGKNNGRSDGFQNPDGDLPLGAYQADQNQEHSHVYGATYNLINRDAPIHYETRIDLTWNVTRSTTDSGGNESRPRSVTVNIFIRIN